MTIYTPGYNPDKIGGGWSWLANFRKCFADSLVETAEEADIIVITSVSMLSKLSEIPLHKKIVLRVDNILKRSTNSDIYPFEGDKVTRMEGMRLLAQRADLVVYQSAWSKNLLDSFLSPRKSVTILNSADETIFNPTGNIKASDKDIYLYSRSSNHDNKGWHVAYYAYQEIFRHHSNSELWLTGRFSSENIPNSFDFFNGETVKYFGFLTDPEQMAFYMKNAHYFLYSYHMDCMSNTLLESLLCHCNIIYLDLSGGAAQIKDCYENFGDEYFYLNRMKQEYEKAFLAL